MIDENTPLKDRGNGSEPPDPKNMFASFSRDVWVCSGAIATMNYNLCINSYSMYIITDEVGASAFEAALVGGLMMLGVLCGQLFFGFFTEWLGRRPSFYLCCLFILLGAALSGFAGNVTKYDLGGILRELAAYRCVVGFGCGGLYPLITTVIRDNVQDEALANSTIAMVFGPVGSLGLLLAPLTCLCVTFGAAIKEMHWRITFFAGLIPAVVLMCFGVGQKRAGSALLPPAPPLPEGRPVCASATLQRLMRAPYKELLFGSSAAWFLSDILFFGNFFMQAYIVDLLMAKGLYDDDYSFSINFIAQIGIVCNTVFWLGTLCSVYRLRRVSALALQLQGFGLAAVVFFGVCAAKAMLSNTHWHTNLVLYVLTLFAPGYGPAPTTFLMPSLMFPAKLHVLATSIAAASGKLGATVCVACVLLEKVDMANLQAIYGSVALLGVGTTVMQLKSYMLISNRSGRSRGRAGGGGSLGSEGGSGSGSSRFVWSTRIQSDDEHEDRRLLLPEQGYM